MTRPVTSTPLEHVLELERELQSPACRADATRLRALLAPDFSEIGASGRQWDLDGIVEMLSQDGQEQSRVPITMSGLVGRTLAPGVIQVSWESKRGDQRARRTSIWCQRHDAWQQVHHQGTVMS